MQNIEMYLPDILEKLHLVYENFKLHTLLSHHLPQLAQLLYKLACQGRFSAFHSVRITNRTSFILTLFCPILTISVP
mgnify:CR=1 FL=1